MVKKKLEVYKITLKADLLEIKKFREFNGDSKKILQRKSFKMKLILTNKPRLSIL